MKLLVIGSTQTKHITDFFSVYGCKCTTFEAHHNCWTKRIKNLLRLLRADIIYQVSGMDVQESKYLRIAKFFHKKIVMHWIGTDVMLIRNSLQKDPREINKGCINLAVTKQLCQELHEVGIESAYVPIFPMKTLLCEKVPMPKQHAVLSYIPALREDFYGMPIVRALAEQFSDVPFYIVANDGQNDSMPPRNLHYMGFLPKDELYRLYKKTSVLLRIPIHDGLPVMMLEAQGLGRAVIHPFPYPFIHCPKNRTVEDIAACLKEIVDSPPVIDDAAIEYIRSHYTSDTLRVCYQEAGLEFLF